MKTVKDAVEYYLPKKQSGEMSMSDIRHELTENSAFSEVEINSICSNVSNLELDALGEKKMYRLDFLNSVYFSYFMILGSLAIFIYSIVRFMTIRKLIEDGAKVDDFSYFLPIAFMVGSIIYLVRHVTKVVKRSRNM